MLIRADSLRYVDAHILWRDLGDYPQISIAFAWLRNLGTCAAGSLTWRRVV